MAPSIIGEALTIIGNIISDGEVKIEGSVQGYVFCPNLIIGDRGRVAGGVVAEAVTVHGSISGSINALCVTLKSNSYAEANIFSRALKLEHGGYFEGQSQYAKDPLSQALTHLKTFKQAAVAAGNSELHTIDLERAA